MKMKKYLLMLFLFTSITTSFANEEKWTGYISDSKCGAKGNNEGHASCAVKCIKAGASPVLVVDDKVYKIDNPSKVSEYIGKKVTVEGTMNGDTIKVSK